MSNEKYFTVIYKGVAPGDEARELGSHPKVVGLAWGNLMHERDALEATLATQRQAEPVALLHHDGEVADMATNEAQHAYLLSLPSGTKLYTAPSAADEVTDGQRLDWLSHAGDVGFGIVTDAPYDGRVYLGHDLGPTVYGETLREAIDAAMQKDTK